MPRNSVGQNCWNASGLSFYSRQTKPFRERGHYENIECGKEPGNVIARADQPHGVFNSHPHSQFSNSIFQRAFTSNEKSCICSLLDYLSQNLYQKNLVLDWNEAANIANYELVRRNTESRSGAAPVLNATEPAKVHGRTDYFERMFGLFGLGCAEQIRPGLFADGQLFRRKSIYEIPAQRPVYIPSQWPVAVRESRIAMSMR
jgi:hypothetical protein